jgi:hypothetical protein
MLDYTRENLDGLDASLHALYEQGEGGYKLKVNGIPQGEDVTGLKKQLDTLLGEKKTEAAKRKEAEETARLAAEEAARKGGDVAALDKSWQDKFTKREQELLAERDGFGSQIKELTVGRTATELATEMAVSGSAKALLPHIQARLSMDTRDGKPTVVVLDANGQPSAATLAELKAEFASDPAFAPLIVGSKATGSGADGAKVRAGGAGVPKSLAECKGDKALEQQYYDSKFSD